MLLQEQLEKEKENRQGTSLGSYRAFFRELDMEVLRLLQYGLLSRSLLDSEQHTNVRTLYRINKTVCRDKVLSMYQISLRVFLHV